MTQLAFGLNEAIPATVDTAWGARLIFPSDLVYDRQGAMGDITGTGLAMWLNGGGGSKGGGALRAALEAARNLSNRYKLTRDGSQRVILHRDNSGVVVACPKSSHGYLYIAAWLHNGDDDKQPAPEYQSPVTTRDPWEA